MKNPADFLSRMTIDQGTVNNLNIFATGNSLSKENIKSNQEQDKDISSIIQKINSNDTKIKEKYFIDSYSGLIMEKYKPKNKTNLIVNKILLPKTLVKKCLEIAHAPHIGTRKTYDMIKNKYAWKGSYLDTKNFCENCSQCLKNKSKPKQTTSDHIPKKNLAPGEYIACDIVGKFPRSIDGKFYIFTVIDYSRYLETFALPNVKSSALIKCLNEYFARFGVPKIL